MQKYYDIIKTIALFHGIPEHDYAAMFRCLDVKITTAKKGELLLLAGDKPAYVGAVLAGQLYIVRDDIDGQRTVVAALAPGEIFAESLCCAAVSESPVSVVADSNAVVMMLKFDRLLFTGSDSCGFHTILTRNMLQLIASKNILLQSRIEIIGRKSIRTKVLRYLESFAPRRGGKITIPFNREELADFLCVERSALSHELSRMKADGLIEYRKNIFLLK